MHLQYLTLLTVSREHVSKEVLMKLALNVCRDDILDVFETVSSQWQCTEKCYLLSEDHVLNPNFIFLSHNVRIGDPR